MLTALWLPLLALVSDLTAAPRETGIFGGDIVGSCGWPSTVYLESNGGACTGVLVHPYIVMTAAHCVSDGVPSKVRFGELSTTASVLSQTANCHVNPGWTGNNLGEGEDYAYCRLESPVTTVPIIPVAAGCEKTAIVPGARIMHVGFGTTETGDTGRKEMLATIIDAVTNSGEIISGDADKIICNGDSGGPTFVYLDPAHGGDGSWRVAAIHSWSQGASPSTPDCYGQAGSVLASNAVAWIEADSGIDITPCTAGEAWQPSAHCGGLATEPWIGAGSYPMGCNSPDMVAFSSVCGPGLDATPDNVPPSVAILSPTTAQEFSSDTGTAKINVEVDISDTGWGVKSVELTIRSVSADAEQVDARNEWQDWQWQVDLPRGSYEVQVVATDHAGNASEPVTVCFGVGEPGCGAETGEGSGGSDGGDSTGGERPSDDGTTGEPLGTDDGGETTGAAAADDDAAQGCSCRTGEEQRPIATFLGAFVLLALGRRASKRRA